MLTNHAYRLTNKLIIRPCEFFLIYSEILVQTLCTMAHEVIHRYLLWSLGLNQEAIPFIINTDSKGSYILLMVLGKAGFQEPGKVWLPFQSDIRQPGKHFLVFLKRLLHASTLLPGKKAKATKTMLVSVRTVCPATINSSVREDSATPLWSFFVASTLCVPLVLYCTNTVGRSIIC